MNNLLRDRIQHHAKTSCATLCAIAAVFSFMTGMQATPALGADPSHAGSTAAPSAVLPVNHTPPARQMPPALEKLITDFRKARNECSADSTPPGFASHIIKRGETPKMIIRKYWADLPLKEDFLRSMLEKLNPEASVKGLSTPLKTGTLLTIPSSTLINALLFNSSNNSFGKPLEDEHAAPTNSEGNFAAGWVQFP